MTTDDTAARRPADDVRRSRERAESERPTTELLTARFADGDAIDRLFGSLPTVRVSRLTDDERER